MGFLVSLEAGKCLCYSNAVLMGKKKLQNLVHLLVLLIALREP